MPTYDYRCSSCGHTFEEFHSMKDDPLMDCPTCHKPALQRLMAGGAGMIFKGSGFYLTDYTRSGSKSAAPSNEASSKPDPTPSAPPTGPTAT
ncbi:MAG: zinc ribbon domain-containing protein [Bacteroidetes bacterium]|nr:zinc ribbon domain-containing protein [Bacteroidota bacterium]